MEKIKLLLGGSPCTHWSIAQKGERETEAKGLGWELFKNYLIAKEKFQPDFFLYENNKSAAEAIKHQIAHELGVWNGTLMDGEDNGVRFTYINSALVSAQSRQRFYVTNFGEIDQPEDRGIVLRDVLEIDNDEIQYELKNLSNGDQYNNTSPRRIGSIASESQAHRVYSPDGKSVNLVAHGGGQGAKTGLYLTPVEQTYELDTEYFKGAQDSNLVGMVKNGGKYRNKKQPSQQYRAYTSDEKSICLNAGGKDTNGAYMIPTGVGYRGRMHEGKWCKQYEAREDGKANTITTAQTDSMVVEKPNGNAKLYTVANGMIQIDGREYPIKLADGDYIIRKLTVTECCRLQTLPDNYCKAVSASRAYEGIGNGWTAEVIIHLLNHALKDVPKDTPIEVLSMYDGIGTGRYCLDKMGFTNIIYKAYEIDKYAMTIANDNYPDIIQCGDAFQVREEDWRY